MILFSIKFFIMGFIAGGQRCNVLCNSRSERPLPSSRTWFFPSRSCIKSSAFVNQNRKIWWQAFFSFFCPRSTIVSICSCPGKAYDFEIVTAGALFCSSFLWGYICHFLCISSCLSLYCPFAFQVSQVYQAMKIESLSRMIPFFDFSVVERISVDAVKNKFLASKVDHMKGIVMFDNMVSLYLCSQVLCLWCFPNQLNTSVHIVMMGEMVNFLMWLGWNFLKQYRWRCFMGGSLGKIYLFSLFYLSSSL